MLLEKLLREAVRKLSNTFVSVVVYGSVAGGEVGSDSNIDLLIVLRNPSESRLKGEELFMETERSCGREATMRTPRL